MKEGQLDLQADGAQVLGPPGVLDGVQRILRLQAADDRGFAACRVDHGAHHLGPFVVGQIARIAQLAAVITSAVLARPHLGDPSSNQATTLESQLIHMIQQLFGQTLSIPLKFCFG